MDDPGSRRRDESPGAGERPDWVAHAAAALAAVADELRPTLERHAVVAAVCDSRGLTSDLLVRDLDGRTKAMLGLPALRRPYVGELLGAARGEPSDLAPDISWRPALTRAFAEFDSCAVVLLDANTVVRSWNAGAERLFGWGVRGAVGAPLADLVKDAGYFEAILAAAAAATEHEWEGWIERADGTRVWASLVVRALRGSDGATDCYCLVARNLDQRHRRELALAERAAHYRALVEQGPFAVAVIDSEAVIRYASPPLLDVLGYEGDEAAGRPALSFVHPDDQAQARSAAAHLAAGAVNTVTLQLRARHRDGSHLWLEVAARALRDASGARTGTLVMARDITESRAVLDRMVRDRRRLGTLAHAAEHGVAIVSIDGDVLSANRAFARILRVSPKTLAGRPLETLLGVEDPERVLDTLRAVAGDGRPRQFEVSASWESSGSPRHLRLAIEAEPVTDGPCDQLTVRLHDETEERSLVYELGQTTERLHRENRELEEFARVVAHDLAGPLRALEGIMNLLEPHVAGDQRLDEMHRAMRSGLTRMRTMVDSALDYTSARPTASQPARVALDSVLERVLGMLADDIAARSASVAAEPLPTIEGDEREIERLFANLIQNALKYAGDQPPVVHISARRDEGGWQIAFADRGIGVDAADRERIFELFGRGRNAEQASGRGIGLATCRRIVERVGGRIWVQDNEPRGSTFCVRLPD